jgi:hypothetical protein
MNTDKQGDRVGVKHETGREQHPHNLICVHSPA